MIFRRCANCSVCLKGYSLQQNGPTEPICQQYSTTDRTFANSKLASMQFRDLTVTSRCTALKRLCESSTILRTCAICRFGCSSLKATVAEGLNASTLIPAGATPLLLNGTLCMTT